MSQTPPDDHESPPSVLQTLAERTGLRSKVLLPDTGSEHGASPVVTSTAGAAAVARTPKGRGNYQMLGEIARGGMGVILKGHDTDLGRDVAVKVLDSELAKNPAVVQRFVEEAQIGGQLQHPGIVPVYELGLMADESPYFTMKLIKGRTLSALFQQRKGTSENRGRLLAIFESVCQTVAYAHSKGVLHRDLKPANIMVGAFGEVQVVDWGLAKVLQRGGVADEKRANESLHTVIATVRSGPGSSGSDSLAGSVMGTPAYMAPEQAQGEVEKLDERADVFSLGSILCELLTGRPPYVALEGEPVLLQAAKAKLDPARARLEACDADRALVQLCLDCLMPARAARPANADEVAKAVHGCMTSVEERAQKAELVAIEERIKAAEERRARRLTVALAGTIVAALALGGGGYWWVAKQRDLRTEQTRNAVEAAHGESIELGQAGKPEAALVAARRALTLAETGEASPALLARATSFVAKAELDLGAVERARALLEQDRVLRERLVDLRLDQIATIGDREAEVALDADFTRAFHDYGVDLEGADLVPALERIRERDIAQVVALGLDDWGRVRRKVHGPKSEKAENLYYLAMDLDSDPARQRMREAIAESDIDTLLDLASPENLHKLEPGSIFVLSAAIWDGWAEHRPLVYRMYDQAVRLHPDDYVLQAVGGLIYQISGRFESSLACRTAALSLRPNDPLAQLRAGDSLMFMGRMTEALGAYRAVLAAHPENPEAYYDVGLCLLQLGEFADAAKYTARALELQDNVEWKADLLAVRYMGGSATRDELQRAIDGEVVPNRLITYLYPLLDAPELERRDPPFVLRTIEEQSAMLAGVDWLFLPTAIAKIRTGDWNGALNDLEGHYATPSLLLLTPAALEFVHSVVYSGLDRDDVARECYARGMSRFQQLRGGDPDAWKRSDVERWRAQAEAALAR